MRAAPRLRVPSAIALVLIVFSCLLVSAAAGGSSAGSTAGNAYEQLVKSDYPVAYWRLNETSGQTAYDATNNHLDLTLSLIHI